MTASDVVYIGLYPNSDTMSRTILARLPSLEYSNELEGEILLLGGWNSRKGWIWEHPKY